MQPCEAGYPGKIPTCMPTPSPVSRMNHFIACAYEMCSARSRIDSRTDAGADDTAGAVHEVAVKTGVMVRVFLDARRNVPVGELCPRLPDEIGLSITICSPIMR